MFKIYGNMYINNCAYENSLYIFRMILYEKVNIMHDKNALLGNDIRDIEQIYLKTYLQCTNVYTLNLRRRKSCVLSVLRK